MYSSPPFIDLTTYVLSHTLGMNDLSAGIYTPEVGWVGPSDPREPYGEMQRVIDEIVEDMQKKREVFLGSDMMIMMMMMVMVTMMVTMMVAMMVTMMMMIMMIIMMMMMTMMVIMMMMMMLMVVMMMIMMMIVMIIIMMMILMIVMIK